MANLKVKDGDAADRFIKKIGTGTDLDPFVDEELSTIAADTTSIDGKTPALGQAAKAASVPVTIASDQEALPLPSNAAQETGGNLATIATNTTTSKNAGAVDAATQRVTLGSRATTRSGGFNSAPIVVGSSRVRQIIATNTGATRVWVQIHDKASALTDGDIPILSFPVEATAGISFLGVADLGEAGTLFATNTRIAISSTYATYTAGAAATNNLRVEVIN